MKKLLILMLVALLGYVLFVYKPIKKEAPENEGIIIKKYHTYEQGINDAKSAVSAIEKKNNQRL